MLEQQVAPGFLLAWGSVTTSHGRKQTHVLDSFCLFRLTFWAPLSSFQRLHHCAFLPAEISNQDTNFRENSPWDFDQSPAPALLHSMLPGAPAAIWVLGSQEPQRSSRRGPGGKS